MSSQSTGSEKDQKRPIDRGMGLSSESENRTVGRSSFSNPMSPNSRAKRRGESMEDNDRSGPRAVLPFGITAMTRPAEPTSTADTTADTAADTTTSTTSADTTAPTTSPGTTALVKSPTVLPTASRLDNLPFDLIQRLFQMGSFGSFAELSCVSRDMYFNHTLCRSTWMSLAKRDFPNWFGRSRFSRLRPLRMRHDWRTQYTTLRRVELKIRAIAAAIVPGKMNRSSAASQLATFDGNLVMDVLTRLTTELPAFGKFGFANGAHARALLMAIRRQAAVAIWCSYESPIEDMLAAFDLFWLPSEDNRLSIHDAHAEFDKMTVEFKAGLPEPSDGRETATALLQFLYDRGFHKDSPRPQSETRARAGNHPWLGRCYLSSGFRTALPMSSGPVAMAVFCAIASRCGLDVRPLPVTGESLVIIALANRAEFNIDTPDDHVVVVCPYSSLEPYPTSSVSFLSSQAGPFGSSLAEAEFVQTVVKRPYQMRRLYLSWYCRVIRERAVEAWRTDQVGGATYLLNFSPLREFQSVTATIDGPAPAANAHPGPPIGRLGLIGRPGHRQPPQQQASAEPAALGYPYSVIHYADAFYGSLWLALLVERGPEMTDLFRMLFNTLIRWFPEDEPFAHASFDEWQNWRDVVWNPASFSEIHTFPIPAIYLADRAPFESSIFRPARQIRAAAGREYGVGDVITVTIDDRFRALSFPDPELKESDLVYPVGSLVTCTVDGRVYFVVRQLSSGYVWVMRGFISRCASMANLRPFDGISVWSNGQVSGQDGGDVRAFVRRCRAGQWLADDMFRFAEAYFRTIDLEQRMLVDDAHEF